MIFYDKVFIGNKFREFRERYGYTQEQVAEKIGINEKNYGKLERGEFLPSLDTFFNTIEFLQISLEEFGFNKKKLLSNNPKRERLLKEIFLSDDDEIELFSEIIHSFKNYTSAK